MDSPTANPQLAAIEQVWGELREKKKFSSKRQWCIDAGLSEGYLATHAHRAKKDPSYRGNGVEIEALARVAGVTVDRLMRPGGDDSSGRADESERNRELAIQILLDGKFDGAWAVERAREEHWPRYTVQDWVNRILGIHRTRTETHDLLGQRKPGVKAVPVLPTERRKTRRTATTMEPRRTFARGGGSDEERDDRRPPSSPGGHS